MRKLAVPMFLWWTLLSIVFASACGDNQKLRSDKALTSFGFTAAGNPGLSANATATVTGSTVAVTVPNGTNVTALVATYETTGATVTVGGTTQSSGATANNFSNPLAYTVTAADGSSAVYTVKVTVTASSAKELTTFAFLAANNAALAADVDATINGTAIAATVPYGTNVTALRATFTSTGASVMVAGTSQSSGVDANNFTAPVEYTVTAGDGTTKVFTVTVTIALNTAHELTSFKFTSALNSAAGVTSDVTATINGTAIAATVPYGTNVTALVATFATTGASVAVGATAQTSGTTANNFTSPVSYVVTAANATTKAYTVTVTIALNTAKDLTAFKFTSALNGTAGVTADVTATINGTAIAATVPYGTDVTGLIATFSTTGASVAVGATSQVSGSTANNFTSPVSYVVTASNASTKTYTVTVTVALNPAKELTAFSFTSTLNSGAGVTADVTATINGTAIAATVPYGTNVTALIATFSTTGASVAVAGTAQSSGITANDFTSPVVYRITAADSTTKDFTVTVTVAANPAKELTAFSFTSTLNSGAGVTADVTATINGTAIAATVPYGTNLTALIATFSTTGASVAVGGTAQSSGITANDFTSPVVYRVTAADATTKDFTVTVTVAANPAKDLTAFSFTSALNGGAGVTADVTATINGTAIAATVPYGTNVTALVATFSTTGASVAVGATAQSSGITANNFTSPVVYRVTAADATTKDFTVTVTVAANPAKDLTAFSFKTVNNAGLASDATGTITGTAIAISVAGGTNVTALVATFTTTGASVAVGATAQTSAMTANDFTNPVTYTVTAANATTKAYTVTVTFNTIAHCATNPQWTPVTCTTPQWDWSTNRAIATTVSTASANHVLAVGTGNGATCSLSGAGWVSTVTFAVSNCNASWYHLGGSYTGNCGGWDGTAVRHLADGADDCYAY